MTFTFKSTFPALPSLLYALTFVCHITPALSTCYNFDGSTTVGDIACQDSDHASTCCPPGYVCLSNRVCQKTQLVIGSDDTSLFARGSCSDQTWKSPYCPNFCVRGEAPYEEKTSNLNQLGKCEQPAPNVFFCVNSINTDWTERNCSKIDNWFALPGSFDALTTVGLAPDITRTSTSRVFRTLTEPSSSSAASTPASVTTSTTETRASEPSTTSSLTTSISTSVSTSTPSSQPEVSSSNNSKTIGVAAGVGVTAGLALIGVIGWLFIWRKRRGGRVELEAGGGGGGGIGGKSGESGESREGGEVGEGVTRDRFSELPSERVKSELSSERVTSELSAGSWKKASFLDSNIEPHRSVDNEIIRHELSTEG